MVGRFLRYSDPDVVALRIAAVRRVLYIVFIIS